MISRYQLFCIMLISRISSVIVCPSTGGFGFGDIAAAATAELIWLLLSLPVLIYSYNGSSFFAAAKKKLRAFGYVIAFAAAFAMSYIAVRNIIFTGEFAQRTVMGGMSGAVLSVLLGAFAVYSAFKGSEAIARSASLFLAATAVVTVVIIIADIPSIRLRDIPAAKPDIDFFTDVWEHFQRGGEYLIFAALLPYTKKCTGSTALVYAASSVIGIALISLFGMSVLGEFSSITEYHFASAAQLADIALFKRLDGLCAAVWSLASGLKSAALLFSSYAAISAALPTKDANAERSIA